MSTPQGGVHTTYGTDGSSVVFEGDQADAARQGKPDAEPTPQFQPAAEEQQPGDGENQGAAGDGGDAGTGESVGQVGEGDQADAANDDPHGKSKKKHKG